MRTSYFYTLLFSIIILTLTLHFFVLERQTNKNEHTQPFPQIGWDTLRSRISYPDIIHRAGIEGAYILYLVVDSTGKIASMQIQPMNFQHTNNGIDSAFFPALTTAIHSTTWIPAQINGKSITASLQIPIIFAINSQYTANPLIIEKEKTKENRSN